MIDFVKQPHTAIFSGPTDCGKTQRLLDVIEKQYKGHFEVVIILCPTISWNKTYLQRPWVWVDPNVWCVNPGEKLCELIKFFSKELAGQEVLFVLDDCIACEDLDKTRSAFLELAISGRHKDHSVWILTQRYTKVPLAVRDQLKQLFIWYPKNQNEFELIHKENFIIESKEQIHRIKEQLKASEYGCLYLRMKYPRTYHVINDRQ